jgi:hypothetical protein
MILLESGAFNSKNISTLFGASQPGLISSSVAEGNRFGSKSGESTKSAGIALTFFRKVDIF